MSEHCGLAQLVCQQPVAHDVSLLMSDVTADVIHDRCVFVIKRQLLQSNNIVSVTMQCVLKRSPARGVTRAKSMPFV